MAFIDENDEQNNGAQPLVGGSSANVSQGVSQAGVGAGGAGGWTNIQAYLKANEGNNNSAGAIKNQLGSEFSKESEGLDTEADKTKSEADKATQSPDIMQASQGGDAADQMTKYLNQGYQGPRTFDYSLGGQAQMYGDSLGSREGWAGLMQGLYDKSAGGRMTTGQRSLQQQLDVNNPLLAQAQTDLQGQYQGLKDKATNTAKGVTDYLGQAETKLQQGQSSARSGIQDQANQVKSQLDAVASGQTAWNPEKQGSKDEYLAKQQATYDRLMGFLGLGSQVAAPTGGSKETSIDGTGSTKIDPLTGQPIKIYT